MQERKDFRMRWNGFWLEGWGETEGKAGRCGHREQLVNDLTHDKWVSLPRSAQFGTQRSAWVPLEEIKETGNAKSKKPCDDQHHSDPQK